MFLYIFRHGETDWNLERRIQGHVDRELSERGVLQAGKLSEYLKQYTLDVLLTSDLSRAFETAKIVNKFHNLDLSVSIDLREAYYGEAQGKTIKDIDLEYGPQAWQQWISDNVDDHDFSFPGGETKRQRDARVFNYLKPYLQNTKYKSIGVSTHAGVVRGLIEKSIGIPKKNHVPNCATFKLEYKNNNFYYISHFIPKI